MAEDEKGKAESADSEVLRAAASGSFPEIMTVKQAAEYLQVNEQVLYRYVREGKVPFAKMGASIRFKKSVIDQWLSRDSWESIGVSMDSSGAPRTAPSPSRPRLPMELD